MLLSFCGRKLQIQINVKHPIHPHILQNPLLKSISNLSDSPDKPSLTLSYLINSCGLSPESALHASKRTKIKTTRQPDSVLEFLKTCGFSKAQITTLISASPRFLCADVNKTLKPKVDFFRGLGLSDSDITSLVIFDPVILLRGLQTQIIPSMNFFRDLLRTNENAIKAFRRCRWMITSHVKNRMQSNIAILKEYGLPDSQVTDIALRKPAILAQKPDALMEAVKRVEELGLKRTSGLFSMALLAMSSLKKSTWEAKLEMLKGLGWSQSDILEALRRMPIFLMYSEKKIRAGLDFYVNTLKWKASEVARDPMLLMFSLEERLIPRSRVWKMLTTKELVDERDLRSMLKVPEKQFLRSYVTKYEKEVPNLMQSYKGLIDKASNSREGFDILVSGHVELEMKLSQVTSSNPEDISITKGKGLVDSNMVEYHKPSHVMMKGRAKRLKSLKENATKGRLCRGCNKLGVSHDKRNCPVLLNRETI